MTLELKQLFLYNYFFFPVSQSDRSLQTKANISHHPYCLADTVVPGFNSSSNFMKCERLLGSNYLAHTLLVADVGATAWGRSGVASSTCRRISPLSIFPNSTRDVIPPYRATSLEFRGVGEQKVSSPYTFALWLPRMTVFSTSYCTLHTTWKARGGPQWHTLKGHGDSAGGGGGGIEG